MAVYQSLSVTEISQNPMENTSLVRILWQSTQTGVSHNETERTAYYTVSVNGGEETRRSIGYTLPMQSTVTLADETVTVVHNSKGEASVTVKTWMNTHISAGIVELSKTLVAEPIPRASILRASDGVIGGTATLAVVKKNSGYSHSIACTFGEIQGFVTPEGLLSDEECIFSADSVELQLPETFYAQIPETKSGQCVLQLQTYDGGVTIGEPQEALFAVSAEEDLCRPEISGTVVDTNEATLALTGDETAMVRFFSNGLCTLTSQGKKAAWIAEKQISGQPVEGDTLLISGIEQDAVTFSVTDSRGYTAEYRHSYPVIPYIKLSAEATATRENAGSQAMVYVSGDCYSGSFGREENALTVEIRVDGREPVYGEVTMQENRYYAFAELTDMDYTRVYGITVCVSDQLMQAEKRITLKKAVPVFDWGEDDFAFHVPVQMDSPLSLENGGTGKSAWSEQGVVVKNAEGLSVVAPSEGALFAENGGDPQFGVLPVSLGGTGASHAAGAQENLGFIYPLLWDTEYATLQRWNGKTVYTKLLDFGTMPDHAVKSVPHHTDAVRILHCQGSTSQGRTLPYGGMHVYRVDLFCDLENIYIDAEADYSAYTAAVQIFYIK